MSYESFNKCRRKLALFEAQLKTFAAEAQIWKALEFTCNVCLEPMDIYVRTPCKHPICKGCFMQSLNSVNGNKCCICRQEIKIAGVTCKS